MHLPSVDEMDEGYRRIKYVRYADDFIIGVIGSKADCVAIKEDIKKLPRRKAEINAVRRKNLNHTRKSKG